MKLTTAQIGRSGELLVQFKLLMGGIESAPMTTDAGVDLVAFDAQRGRATTIQVKSNLQAKPGGGKGKPHLDWWVSSDCPADWVAFVDLERLRVWLVKMADVPGLAQQHPDGRYHFFMSIDPTQEVRRDGRPVHEWEFERYVLENRLHELLRG